jgi:ribosomal protein S18 acetylase RimI-like enzyme
MEIASSGKWQIRQATKGDTAEISRLIGQAAFRHLHADWNLPADWLGTPGFVLCERFGANGQSELLGCLAVGADPLPAAWVRVAALSSGAEGEAQVRAMLAEALPWLRECGVSILGWLPEQLWPERWLKAAGMRKLNWIVTYGLDKIEILQERTGGPSVRPATRQDLTLLASIEEDAFEPLWRTSTAGLLLAFGRALSFEVAELDGRMVGFQYSVAGQDGVSAHLVRLTVEPEAQGRGVGSALLSGALHGYAQAGLVRVTLNTQLDNHSSHRLYERFGFRRLGDMVPVWAMSLV